MSWRPRARERSCAREGPRSRAPRPASASPAYRRRPRTKAATGRFPSRTRRAARAAGPRDALHARGAPREGAQRRRGRKRRRIRLASRRPRDLVAEGREAQHAVARHDRIEEQPGAPRPVRAPRSSGRWRRLRCAARFTSAGSGVEARRATLRRERRGSALRVLAVLEVRRSGRPGCPRLRSFPIAFDARAADWARARRAGVTASVQRRERSVASAASARACFCAGSSPALPPFPAHVSSGSSARKRLGAVVTRRRGSGSASASAIPWRA